jgi:ABC-type transporter Mla maintaining outer membrane lipid asymmetry ATPase subunit MlaF
MKYSSDTALIRKINDLISILQENSKKVSSVVRRDVEALLESISDEVLLLENYNQFLEEENAKLSSSNNEDK